MRAEITNPLGTVTLIAVPWPAALRISRSPPSFLDALANADQAKMATARGPCRSPPCRWQPAPSSSDGKAQCEWGSVKSTRMVNAVAHCRASRHWRWLSCATRRSSCPTSSGRRRVFAEAQDFELAPRGDIGDQQSEWRRPAAASRGKCAQVPDEAARAGWSCCTRRCAPVMRSCSLEFPGTRRGGVEPQASLPQVPVRAWS